MAGIITPSGLVNELTVVTDGDTISEVNVPGETINRKIKKSVDRTYFQGTLPAEVAGIKAGTEQLNPRSFTSGRFDSQELVSGALSVSGWYTIAETEDVSDESYSSKIKISSNGGIVELNVSFRESTNVKSFSNTTFEKISQATYNANGDLAGMTNFRIAKSDSVNGAGIKIQCFGTSVSAFITSIYNNLSRFSSGAGLKLVTPYLDNTPILPDGVTVGTFLEAGEELSFDASGITLQFPNMIGFKTTNDQIRCTVMWPEIPKQGTSMVITSAPTMLFIDGVGAIATITGAHTISNFEIQGKNIVFYINETGFAVSINTGPLFLRIAGDGFKLTIT